ncbi:MAG: hypothetical protein NC401_19955, partial [Ruminococcus sp.]|nr:hypothetical protein [Ruminococcus sp.]
MNKTEKYFDLLTEVLAEKNFGNDEMGSKIDEIYGELYAIIDTVLTPKLETVADHEKYVAADDIKQMLSDYKLLFLFPELVCKHMVAFYNTDIAESVLTNFFGAKNENLFASKLFDNIPCVFSVRDNDTYKIQNASGNIIDINFEKLDMINELQKKSFFIPGMITMISASINNDYNNLAFSITPDG